MLRAVPVDFDSKWSSLHDVVYRLIRCEYVDPEQWNASFSDVYALCVSRPISHAPALYSKTTELIRTRVEEILQELQLIDDSQLLPAYAKHWEVFHRGLINMDNLYRFVNQQYVKNFRPTDVEMCFAAVLPLGEGDMMEILEYGLAFWRNNLISNIKSSLSSCLTREVLKYVQLLCTIYICSDRMDIPGQQNFIHPCLSSFMTVGELRGIERAGMDTYNEIFQNPLLETTSAYYSDWALQRESQPNYSQYVAEALELRNREVERAKRYYKCSLETIQSLFQKVVVEQRLNFLNTGMHAMTFDDHKSDFKNLFQLLTPSVLCSELLHLFGEHIKLLVRDAIASLSKDINIAQIQFVENLCAIRDRYLNYIEEVFDGMNFFRTQMDKAFSLAINERSSPNTLTPSSSKSPLFRPSELLSRYMDTQLRKLVKTSSGSEIESKLVASIVIFKYIDDKDVFQKYYQRMLCKRLIFNNSSLMESEEFIISQLKTVCGYEFTCKFQRMFNDVQLSPELNRNFAQYLEPLDISFKFGYHFHVLTCSWPINLVGTPDFILPPEVQSCTSHFEKFYTASHQGRKMRWAHNYSSAELMMRYTDKAYQVQAPALYASILLFFDTVDSDRILVRDLLASIQLCETDNRPSTTNATASTTVAAPTTTTASSSSTSSPAVNLGEPVVQPSSFTTPSQEAMDTTTMHDTSGSNLCTEPDFLYRLIIPLIEQTLLSIETPGASASISSSTSSADNSPLTMDSYLVLNRSFTHKRLKLRLNFGSQNKESTQTEADHVERQVNEDRRFFIQAAIVRILKARKQINHSHLIEGVLQQASNRFQPQSSLIKRCIEGLIDKGFLERSPEDPNQYNYLA